MPAADRPCCGNLAAYDAARKGTGTFKTRGLWHVYMMLNTVFYHAHGCWNGWFPCLLRRQRPSCHGWDCRPRVSPLLDRLSAEVRFICDKLCIYSYGQKQIVFTEAVLNPTQPDQLTKVATYIPRPYCSVVFWCSVALVATLERGSVLIWRVSGRVDDVEKLKLVKSGIWCIWVRLLAEIKPI